MNAHDSDLLNVDALIGASVESPDGTVVGTAVNVLFEITTGKLQIVLIEANCDTGESIATPWGSLKWNGQRECLVLDLPAEQFTKGPGTTGGLTSTDDDFIETQTVDFPAPDWEKPENYTG